MSAQNRNLDAAGLRRMQDLDKALFAGATGRNRANTGQLPPLINAWADPGGPAASGPESLFHGSQLPVGGGVGAKLNAYSQHLAPVSVTQRSYGGSEPVRQRTGAGGNRNSGQRKAANARPPRRSTKGPPLEPLLSTTTSISAPETPGGNPWEAFLEAAPATRYGGNLARDPGGLQLLMPSGASHDSMASFENRLMSYIQPATGPSGTAAGGGAAAAAAAAAAPPPQLQWGAASPVRPGSSPRRPGTSPLRLSTGFHGRLSGISPTRPTTSNADSYSTFGHLAAGDYTSMSPRGTNGSAQAWQAGPPPPPSPPGPHGPSLPPLAPRSALHGALAVPPPGAEQPWGGAGLPYGMYGALAELRGGITAGLATTPRDTFQHGGMNAVTAAAVAAAAVAGVVNVADDPLESPSLSHMITAKPTGRRQVQLMADWLDNMIGALWEQHVAAGGGTVLGPLAGSSSGSGRGNLVSNPDGTSTMTFGDAPNGSATARSGGRRQATSAAEPAAAAAPVLSSNASGALNSGKAALAVRFGMVATGLKELSSSMYHVAMNSQLWASMVEATAAVASTVVQSVAHRCWEEGALLARLWNLHTALLDSGLAAARKTQEQLSATAVEQAAKIRRLDPLIDWELESRTEREVLSTALESSRAEALLASRERDALLRENDKIIAHYRKELKTYRREQRRNAYRLARKLRNTQQQLELMTRDRDMLFNAVSYTKAQSNQLVDHITTTQGHVRSAMGATGAGSTGRRDGGGEEALPELIQIDTGLRNMLTLLGKVREVAQDAEDSHFVTEEQVTSVAAADTTGDELLDEVLAEGDPEPSPEELEAAAAAAAEAERQQRQDSDSDYDSNDPDPNSALSMLAEAALRGTGESSEEETDSDDDDSSSGEYNGEGGSGSGSGQVHQHQQRSQRGSGQSGGELGEEGGEEGAETRHSTGSGLHSEISPTMVVDGEGFLDEDELAAIEQERGDRSTTSSRQDDDSQPSGAATPSSRSSSPEPAPQPAAPPMSGKKKKKKKKNKATPSGNTTQNGAHDGLDSHMRSSSPTTPLPSRRMFDVLTMGCQTDPELLRGIADPDITEAARQMRVLRDALGEIGIVGTPNDDADGTDGLLTALRQYMSSLSSEAGDLSARLDMLKELAESSEAARADLALTAEARGREVAAVRRELLDAKKRHAQLCNTLEALGIDPRNPTLPNAPDGDTPGLGVSDTRAPGSRGREGEGKGGKGGKGGKVSRVAAVKEKARERAMGSTVPQAPVLGRSSTAAVRSSAITTGFASPTNRVQLPAAMLAAAQQRAAEAVASGEGEGGGGTAAALSAWRPGGAGSGPTPVYIRPDRAAATARLQDALTRYSDVKPRTLEWLVKLIDSMYRGKATSDEQRAKVGQEPLTLIEYMFQHLSGQYGTKDLVNQYAAQLVATCLQNCASDPRVGTFQRFLMEEWDTRVLCAYMDATRKLLEPSRVPCCDFPADYLAVGARKGDSAPVDVRKALWVSERVLMRRAPKTAFVFAQLLNSKAEPISPAELDSYFVSPGSYGAEIQQVRQFEMSRGEFKRVSSAAFLDALCGEYARMENAYRELLPETFSRFDSDADGWITRQDVSEMFTEMLNDMAQAGMQLPESSTSTAYGGAATAGSGMNAATLSDADREAALEALWTVLTTAEADARSRADTTLVYPDGGVRPPGGGVVPPSAVTHLSDSGFFEGAFRSDFVRGWARAFKTVAAQLPGGMNALEEMDLHTAREAARRLLSVLVTRHWTHHGETLEGYFAEAGALAEQQLKQQAMLLDGDMGGPHGDGRDGPRRASALVTVMRLLLVKKADRFTSLLTVENLTGGPHNGPPAELEDLLERLTAAVRLLYGPADSVWVVGAEMDELESLSGLDAADVGALPAGYKRWLARVAVRCCAMHDRLHLSLPPSPLISKLQIHHGVSHFARTWRRATAAAVAARRRAAVARTTGMRSSGTGTGTGGGSNGGALPSPSGAAAASTTAPTSPGGGGSQESRPHTGLTKGAVGTNSARRSSSGTVRVSSPGRPTSSSQLGRTTPRTSGSRPTSGTVRQQSPSRPMSPRPPLSLTDAVPSTTTPTSPRQDAQETS